MEPDKIENKLKYPKSVFFIFVNETCERFSYQGMKAILALYFSNALKYDTDTSTTLYHMFNVFCYVSTLFGGIIADSFWGKYKTILYLSILYSFGLIILSTGAVPIFSPFQSEISFIGLILIAFGTGGIKPCVSTFGAEQFNLPEQASQLQRYFSIYVFIIECGTLFSSFIMPSLRKDVKCFGEDSCFSLAFGVASFFMITAVVIFVIGKPLYKINEPKGNVILISIKCIWRALKNKTMIERSKTSKKKKHWLEYADDKFSKKQISDIRDVLNVVCLIMPLTVFWTLVVQLGSRWMFQGTKLDGRFLGYIIKPDQMHVIQPFMYLFFVPIFDLYVLPTMAKIGLRTPLRKITIVLLLSATAYVMAALLEFNIQDSYSANIQNEYAELRIYNSLNCSVKLNPPVQNILEIDSLSEAGLFTSVEDIQTYETVFEVDSSCPYAMDSFEYDLKLFSKKTTSYFISESSEKRLLVYQKNEYDELKKDTDGFAKIRIFYSSSSQTALDVKLRPNVTGSTKCSLCKTLKANMGTNFILVAPKNYNLFANNSIVLKHVVIDPAEIDTILLRQTESNIEGKIINVAPPNKVHIFWQVPQYLTMSAAEILMSLTGPHFLFTQAPESMKSLIHAFWLFIITFGNLLIIVVTELRLFSSRAHEFLFYAGLMGLNTIIFIVLSKNYTYVETKDEYNFTELKMIHEDEVLS